MSRLLLPILLVCAVAVVTAQEPAPAFEVASVKVNKSGQVNRLFQPQPGGRFNVTNMPLRNLITFAYQVRPFQVEGGPDWIDTVSFDIVAKAPGEVPPVQPGSGPSPYAFMLRTLLADRFKLVVHNETRDGPIYALTLARQEGRLGPDLSPSKTDCTAIMKAALGGAAPPPVQGDRLLCGLRIGPNRIDMGGFAFSELSNALAVILGRTVVDRTGLNGNYDLRLTYSSEQIPGIPLPAGIQLPPSDPNAPSIFTALQEQAGLKLESTRGPVALLIIDRAEMPVED